MTWMAEVNAKDGEFDDAGRNWGIPTVHGKILSGGSGFDPMASQ